MSNLPPDANALIVRALKAAKKPPPPDPEACQLCGKDSCDGTCQDPDRARIFARIDETTYSLKVPTLGVELIADRLRRERDGLICELTVKCSLPGARTLDGVLAVSDFNLSGQRSRSERAKYLEERSRAGLDWSGFLEELAQRVLNAERIGEPAVLLRDVPRPNPDDLFTIDGFPLLRRHPMILFGDGGSMKSYFALYLAGRLDMLGMKVGIFDWELAGDDHRERLGRLFNDPLPAVRYARCERPLHYEMDRLRRIVREEALNYIILDSIAFACDGPPEAAEVAGRYFRANRQLGELGSLHIAHVSKGDNADRKPFGSSFWHNGARSTWYVKQAEQQGNGVVNIGMYNRKSNLGGLRKPLGFDVSFTEQATAFTRAEIFKNEELSRDAPLVDRIAGLVHDEPMTRTELRFELGKAVKGDAFRKALERGFKTGKLVKIDAKRVGWPE